MLSYRGFVACLIWSAVSSVGFGILTCAAIETGMWGAWAMAVALLINAACAYSVLQTAYGSRL